MKSQQYFLRTAFRFIPVCLFVSLLGRCDSSDDSEHVSVKIPEVTPLIVRTLPHDNQAFTQGLIYHKGKIFESTGLRGQSSLRCINADNGFIHTKIPVADVFAEGLVLKDNFLIQLTWHSGSAIVYSYPDLLKIGLLSYEGEGWGITTDGSLFIMSNGSDTLYWRDNKFTVRKKRAVTLRGQPLTKLNELQYAGNRIYANVWYSDFIFEIDPESGKVLRIINCSTLVKKIGSLKEQNVLNGIAYNKENDTFFITGKNWPLIFEVKIPQE